LLPAPVGVPGEIYIAGVGLARGYLSQAALTAEKFIPDPFNPEPGHRFYRTGDLGRYSSDGVIEYLGREDDQVKIRGFRIELGEIETALTGHAAVREAVVLAREDRPGVKRLAAYVIVDHEDALSVEEFTRFVEKKLPGYMVPATIVMRTELPLTVSGKVDRAALLSLSANEQAFPMGSEIFIAPRTNTERILAEIWAKVLGLERVSVRDNFFALGGDSILSLQIIARAGRSGLRLTPRQIFENQTIAALAAVIDESAIEMGRRGDGATGRQGDKVTGRSNDDDVIAPSPRRPVAPSSSSDELVEDGYALSPIQEGLLFHSVYAQQPEMYVGQLALEIRGKLNVDAFERAWREMARRHAVLRTLFVWDRGERPIQVVLNNVTVPFEREDWRALSESEQTDRLDSLLESDRRRGFILSQAPLMRLTLIRVAEEDYWFIWSHHHLILDGWSVPIVLKEVIEFYRAFCQGESLSLEPSRPFREYVAWLAQQDLSQAEAYWRKALEGFAAPTPLVGDRLVEKSLAQMDEGESYGQQQISLSCETTDRLRTFARRNQLTLNTLIQGGWALLLGQYSREDDVVFGVTLSGRSTGPSGKESMVGMFINTLPMRIQIQPDAPVVAWLKQIQRRQLELTQYEYSPLSQVQAWSDIPRGAPLFESILVFENYPVDGRLLGQNEWLNVSVLRSWDQTNYPITVAGVIADDSLSLQIGYERRRFDEPTVTRMLGHLMSLLESVADDPEANLSSLPSLTDEEKRQLSVDGEANRGVFNSKASPTQSRGFVPPRTRTESILANIWAEVLGLERVGIGDNFFALGGDSILSLQIVARANNAGLPLTPRHIFEHRTIAELAAVVGETSLSRAEQGSVSGPVPLTPVQCWFFEQEMVERHHYNQAVMLEAKCPLDPDLLRQSFRHLLSHHDALRLRFTQTQSGWDQFNALESVADEANDFFSLGWDRLKSVRGPHRDGQTGVCPTEQIASIQAGLNLERGPLVRAALLRGADEQPDRLLIAIHHLAVDAVSWRILLEDLQTAYQQLSRREKVELPPKTTSFKRWAEALREYVERERQELEREAAYWLSPSRREVERIPVDASGENLEGDARSLAVSLSEERTRALFREAQAAYRTEVSDLLLAALAEAFREWTGELRLLVDLEGHGREEVVGEVNVARTVGWFTTIYPVLLEAPAERDAGSAIKSVKEQLRGIPNKGINYGVLRYLVGKKGEMEEMPQAEVSFNYLGRLEQGMGEGEMLKLTTETCGRVRGERNERRYLLDVEASVIEGRLRVEWEYNERLHRAETIERLAGLYLVALERLIDHCLGEDAGGFTPSDFPDAELSQTDLDDLIAILNDEPEKY
jgi:non-ribosomal peptide synthase protein (TIGR01720 family)